MEKELTLAEVSLPEVFRLLSEGKKVRNGNWTSNEYIHFVDKILVDNSGCAVTTAFHIQPGFWYEYVIPPFKFDDFVHDKFIKTNLTILKEISEDETFTYEVVLKRDEYIVLDTGSTPDADAYGFVLFKNEFEELKAYDEFFIEEVV